MQLKGSFRFDSVTRFFAVVATVSFLFSATPLFGFIFVADQEFDSLHPRSLRGALALANRFGGRNTIVLTRKHYRLTIQGAYENFGSTGDLDVRQGNLTITGINTNVMIDASALGDRVFHVFAGAQLTLKDVKVVNGHAAAGVRGHENGSSGGAIRNEGVVFATLCTFVGNSSGYGWYRYVNTVYDGGDGGAIWNSGKLVLSQCVIASNTCWGEANGDRGCNGGGLWNSGVATLDRCEVRENVAGITDWGTPGGRGGGVCNKGVLKMNDSTIVGNRTTDGNYDYDGNSNPGGGIYNEGNARIVASVISRNITGKGQVVSFDVFSTSFGNGGSGAGICNFGTMSLESCTISENATGSAGFSIDTYYGGYGAGGDGAGLFNSGVVAVTNSTFNGNVAGRGADAMEYDFGGRGGRGGAVCNFGESIFVSCTISGNFAGGSGAGNMNLGGGVGAVGSEGGGIYNARSLGLISCTVVLNAAGDGGRGGDVVDEGVGGNGGDGGSGGGVFTTTNGAVRVGNTLMAYNHAGNGGVAGAGQVYVFDGTEYTIISSNGVAGSRGIGMDASGSFTTLGFNFILFGDGSYGITNGLNSDTIGSTENPVLAYRLAIGRLAMNGGPTATHALFGSSMLIDKGNSFGVRTDQRGQPRTVNVVVAGRPNGGDGTDIGAYEFNGLIPPFPQPPPPPASPE